MGYKTINNRITVVQQLSQRCAYALRPYMSNNIFLFLKLQKPALDHYPTLIKVKMWLPCHHRRCFIVYAYNIDLFLFPSHHFQCGKEGKVMLIGKEIAFIIADVYEHLICIWRIWEPLLVFQINIYCKYIYILQLIFDIRFYSHNQAIILDHSISSRLGPNTNLARNQYLTT